MRLSDREIKGEITLLIGAAELQKEVQPTHTLSDRLRAIMGEQSLDEKAALKVLAKETGRSKSEIYREFQRSKTRESK